MLKKLALGLACVVLSFSAPAFAAPEVGKPAPDFTATDINGQPFKLSDHKGKIVVLEWTNPQCPFVVKHYGSGNMQKLQAEETAKGVAWVSINSSAAGKEGHQTAEEAKANLESAKAAPTTLILDETGDIGKLYDAKTTPHMFVVDAAGNLAYAGAIDDNSSPKPETIEGAKNYVTAAVDELLAGNPVTTPATQSYGCSVKYAN